LFEPIAPADGATSELIVLLDERAKIWKTKHYSERDQQADCAELHCCNQIGVDERCSWPRPFRRRFLKSCKSIGI